MAKDIGNFFSTGPQEVSSSKEGDTPSPSATESKPSASPEPEKKVVEEQSTKEEAVKEEKKETEPAKGKEKAQEKKEEAAPVKEKSLDDWKSEAETNHKRWQDTARWANDLNQKHRSMSEQNNVLMKNLDILNKKLDGTYDETRDGQMVDPSSVQAADQTVSRYESVGRAKASLSAAYEKYGQKDTDGFLSEYVQRFGNDPFVQQRITSAEMPVEEAISAVKLARFFDKYGNTPDLILEALKKEVLPSIRAEEKAKVMESLKAKNEEPKGVTELKAAPAPNKSQKPTGNSLKKLFG